MRERRGIFVKFANFAVRKQAEFNQRLEAVANAQNQSVALQKFHDFFGKARIAKRRGDKFSGTVRLVAAAEAAGQHDNLRGANFFDHCGDTFFDLRGRQVTHDKNIRLPARLAPNFCAVVFAIRAGEHGNKNFRTRDFYGGRESVRRVEKFVRNVLSGSLRTCRENFFKRLGKGAFHVGKRNFFVGKFDNRLGNRFAQKFEVQIFDRFDDKTAVIFREEIFSRRELEADIVADSHFGYRRRNAAGLQALRRNNFARAD